MLKARATTTDGRTLIILGLEPGNLDRLAAGEPIYIDTDDQPPDGLALDDGPRLILYAGVDHDELVATLEHFTEQETTP